MQRVLGAILIAASIVALGSAWYGQHIDGYVPCELCLLERGPWRLVFLLGILALIVPGRGGRWAAILSLPVLAADMVLAVIHGGVEHKWWQSPLPSCHAPIFHRGTFHARMASMPLRPSKPCDDPTYLFNLPFSMSVMGGLFALLIFIIATYGLMRYRPRSRI
ncbi:disulfide bond formation protein B [Neoasaia chiangmaiensis NBRC 101099]|uniref:Uncharacterized protein n=2 Tax=Neoasaia chiangmaiensis TaxID=320497 RepID=A0A1U9KRF5_9PROT|nr:hypothetical protein A0U93_10655 [Neoasaia chiangmaiensis]GBR39535.1 disulfide bond formation protein B [Neoasaia chiangmaiensis NBRC 101099]GEN14627.1 hypothetical protein NCH01_10580 [Neoasaia chiangmaiensis]